MIRIVGDTVAAELAKLRGLPAVLATLVGTVVVGAVLGALLAASVPANAAGTVDAVQVAAQAIVFLQVGTILVGVLAVGSEYAGRQIVTTMAATPNRFLLLAAKAAAYLIVAVGTSLATVGASAATAWITLDARGIAGAQEFEIWPLFGAAIYLTLIGLLAFLLAVLLRSLIPPLVAMLALVLIVSPLLAEHTEHARWLPNQAGKLLYLADADPLLTPLTGTLVLLAWIAAVGALAGAAFYRRDA